MKSASTGTTDRASEFRVDRPRSVISRTLNAFPGNAHFWIEQHWTPIRLGSIPVLLLLVFLVYTLVYATGGIKYVYSHSMYLVILLGGFILGAKGGILVGIIAGIALGPFMPIEVATGEQQGTMNWIYRAAFFALAGLFSGVVSDGIKRYYQRVQWFSHHDLDSGLLNRHSLIKQLESITSHKNRHTPVTLSVVALDNAEELEEIYGPEVTEDIILQLAERLTDVVEHDASLFRTNTHHLAVLLPDNPELTTEAILDTLTESCGQAFRFGEILVHGDIRLGYAELNHLEEAPKLFLRKAELALRSARSRFQRKVRFTDELDSAVSQENIELLGELKHSLADGQLSLHYQPKVEIATGKIIGVEALMRWHHPVRGNIPPGKFIPRAEHSTLIHQLTDWALETALTQLVAWRNKGFDLTMAVNISTQNMLQPDFVEQVLRHLDRHEVAGRHLELEVTEGAFMQDLEQSIAKLEALTSVGVRVSIDDFGTGYSSLQYLNYLPTSLLKIDQSFIKTLSEGSGSAPIVKAIINTCHDLGIETVAEGVEDRQSLDFLRHLGCDVAQGYLISRPIPAGEFRDWYRARAGVYRV